MLCPASPLPCLHGAPAAERSLCSLAQGKSLHPLGGRWRAAPDEGCLRQTAAVLRPHQSPSVTAAPLFVTFGDISSRRGENLSRPGEAFIQKIDFREPISVAHSRPAHLAHKKPKPGESPASFLVSNIHLLCNIRAKSYKPVRCFRSFLSFTGNFRY